MRARNIFVVILTVISFATASCSKEDEIGGVDERYDQVHATQVTKGINEYLGKGYKGYQYYANPESCTSSLFDLSAPNVVDIQKAPSHKERFASGENKSQFFDQFSAGVSAGGSYDGFSGEITSNFEKQVLSDRSISYATAHHTQTYYRLTVLDSAPLKAAVKSDLASLEPVALFDRYGTHYLKSIYIGGRISFSTYIDRSSVSQGFDIKATVTAAFDKVVEGSASSESVNKSDVEHMASNKQIDVMGGDPAEASNITSSKGEPSATYNKWARSVPDYMSIADFADKGLVPIYELVSDPGRRAELEKAWEQYMAAHTDEVLKQKVIAIKKNSKFKLRSQDGRYFGVAPYNKTYAYYYPTISNKAVTLKFAGNKEVLENNNNVKIKTTEKFKKEKWSKRVYLGGFKDKKWLYYWTTYGAKTNWFIERVVPATDSKLYFGERVYIKNEHFDEYLAPTGNGFLTTVKKPYEWTIEQ